MTKRVLSDYSPTKIITTVKSITAREIFAQVFASQKTAMPELKKSLWGSSFWSSGFYVDTVGRYGDEKATQNYIAKQGMPDYQPLFESQLTLFDQNILP